MNHVDKTHMTLVEAFRNLQVEEENLQMDEENLQMDAEKPLENGDSKHEVCN